MINVCIVEDQALVRQGLHSMLALAEDIRVVAEAANGREALEVLSASQPDLLLLDYRMPELDGLGVLRALQKAGRTCPTLLLTTFDDDQLLMQAVEAGARGYMLKDAPLSTLLRAIRVVAGGGRWLQPVTTPGLPLPDAAPPAPEDVSLTLREQEVLRLVAGGFSNREIGTLISATEGTIKSYVSNILSKLGERDRTRAVLRAVEWQLL